jgi:hypothetical protein
VIAITPAVSEHASSRPEQQCVCTQVLIYSVRLDLAAQLIFNGRKTSRQAYCSESQTQNMSSFYRGSTLFQSASPLDGAQFPSLHGDLISFVAQARALSIDELPFLWQSTLDPVGTGASAEVRQSFVSEGLSLVFENVSSMISVKRA